MGGESEGESDRFEQKLTSRPLSLSLSLLLFSWVQATYARDIYVDNVAGDDRMLGYSAEPGQGKSGPIKTLAKAMRICGKAENDAGNASE